jgi:hypothetical protein
LLFFRLAAHFLRSREVGSMRRRTFLSRLGGAAVGGTLASMNAWAQTPPPTDDPGATLDILRPLGPKALSPFRVGTRAQLFADDSLVREMHGVDFTLHPAEKRSQPVMKADQPWEGWRLCLFGNVIYDLEEKLFKMWYLGESGARTRRPYFPQTEYNQSLYATSVDGTTWQKPLIGTVPASRGEKFAHNCVALVEQPNVFKDHSEADMSLRYKMITFIGDPTEARGYYTMASSDGLHWTTYSASPISPGRDNINGFYDERRGLYIAYPKIATSTRGYSRRVYYVSASKNFRQWTIPVLSFAPDLRDDMSSLGRLERFRSILNIGDRPTQVRTEFYGLSFYQSESVTFSFPWIFTVSGDDQFGNQDGISEIQLAVSQDLIHWDRKFRVPCIPQGKPGEWDCGFITAANEALRVGDEIWLYYAGSNYSHGCPCFYDTEGSGQGTKYTAAIGLAKWKLDRFISVDSSGSGGSLETVPIVHEGTRLEINAAIKPQGSLLIHVLDAGGRPLEGVPVSDAIHGDELRHVVTWNGNSDSGSFREKPISLRFEMQNAELYSFAFRN